jgi:4-amino-4-deoxy-L-arabinose transferase-like glycosyltransferase
VERNNTPDGTLIFTLLLATWGFIKATETRKLRFLLLGAVLIGIGFNIKMMQALLPLPALYALYFFGTQQGWWRKIAHLGVATLVLIPVSLSWAIIVDLTPADQRPYVGSSETNSALNLIIGYNGIQRLVGNGPGGGMPRNTGFQNGQPLAQPATPNTTNQTQASPGAGEGQADDGQGRMDGNQPEGGFSGGPSGFGGGAFGTGTPGVLRLFQSGLTAQVSWLLPFGLILIMAMGASMSWWQPQTNLHRGLILWGGWLLTCAVFFSIAGFFHQYYLAMLGPPLAAIVAMGVMFLWHLRTTHPIRAALLVLAAVGVTLAFQVYAVSMYQSLSWWIAVPVALGVLGLGLLVLSLWRTWRVLPCVSFALVTVAILVVPTVWSGFTTAYADTSGAMTQAYAGNRGRFDLRRGGPNPANQPQPGDDAMDSGGMEQRVNQALLSYLQANTQDVKYLMVVASSGEGAGYVLATGRPVLYAGGFSGGDPVIDGDDLAALVANGDVRYVLWGGRGGGRGGNSSITSYVQSACTVVTDASLGIAASAERRTTEQPGFAPGRGGQSTLYRCGA